MRFLSSSASERGMGRVAREIIHRICIANPHETHYGLTYEKHFDPNYSKFSVTDRIFDEIPNLVQHDVSDCYTAVPDLPAERFQIREQNTIDLCDRLRELGADEFWNLTPFIGDAFCSIMDIPTIGIIYDATPYIYQKKYFFCDTHKQIYVEHISALQNYDSLISISDTTRSDFILQFGFDPKKIFTVYPLLGNLYRDFAFNSESNKPIQSAINSERYAICVSSYHHSKNLIELCKAWEKAVSKNESNLVLKIVLANAHFRDALLEEVGTNRSIHPVIDLNEDELFSLYLNAEFCVQPSNYEGFGYPVVEALALGLPTLANDTPIFREVAADLPHYFDANDPDEFQSTLCLALTDSAWLDDLRNRAWNSKETMLSQKESTFNRLSTARRYAIDHYMKFSEQSATAIASSYYPDKCGIVDYVDNIASELAKDRPTFVVVRKQLEPNIVSFKNYIVCSENALEILKRRWVNLRIFYQLGGSVWQYFMWRLMLNHPGVAVFHDLTMAIGVFTASNVFDNREVINSLIDAESDNRKKDLISALNDHQNEDDWRAAIESVLNGRLNAYSLSVSSKAFVHDEKFKTILLEDNKEVVNDEDIEIVPLAKRDIIFKMRNLNRSGMREAFFGKTDNIIIGIFGNVVPNKLVLEGLKAICSLQKRYKIHIVMIGNQLIPSYQNEIMDFIRSNNLQENITLKGWVSDEVFDRLLYCCDILLNLRYPANIGMTGPGVQAISAGVPIVISKEAQWSIFDNETGESINSAPEHCISEIESALESIISRLESVRNSAYSKYQNSLRIDQLIAHYKV